MMAMVAAPLLALAILGEPPRSQDLESVQAADAFDSVYTDTVDCPMFEIGNDNSVSSVLCAGVGGYELIITDEDWRMSLTVIAPDRRRHVLIYWNPPSYSSTALGPRAEWRVVRKDGKLVPVALIVRVNAYDGSTSPYSAVAKITPEVICVTNTFGLAAPSSAIRDAADIAATRSCRSQYEE